MNINTNHAQQLLDFIHESASPFHAVAVISNMLENAGFKKLELTSSWQLKKGGKYYVTRNDSSLFAFIVGLGKPENDGFKIIASHSDSPALKIKPNPEMGVAKHFVKLNTEVYGGPILMTWLDRPLSIAGRVSLKSNNPMQPINKLVNFNRPMAIIPSLAIHMNRSVNEGVELNKQKDMLPLLGLINDESSQKEGYLLQLIAKELNIEPNEISDFDLTLNEHSKGCFVGANNEFISSPKIDNLAMAHASIVSLINSKPINSTQMVCVFDNEEVGSVTKQGAGSPVFKHLFDRILSILGVSGEEIYRTIYNSFMISADMAHSMHPNYEEKHDPVLKPVINNGPVIKIHANQKYTTDSDSSAVFESICNLAGVPVQKFVNRSDATGGSTLGNVFTTQLDIRCVDIGNPMLSMHSIRELSGAKDHEYIIKAFETFWSI